MDIQTKDGILLRGIPEGTPEEEIKARIQRIRGLGREGSPRNPGMYTPSGERSYSYADPENLAAHPSVRVLTGMAAPFLGASQLVANALGAGAPANEQAQQYAGMEARGRENLGSTGFDWWKAGGQALSPAYLLPAMRIAPAASTTGRIGQGAAFGAAAGAAEPVTAQDYWPTKLGQVAAGGAVGAAVPGAWEGGKALGRAVRNVGQPYMGVAGANAAAGRLAGNVAGDKADDIIAMLRQPQEFVPGSAPTAGQAAVPAGSAEFSALQKIAETRMPSKFAAIGRSQEGARSQAIGNIAGDASTIAAAKEAREAATAPLRKATFEATRAVGVSTDRLMRQIRGVESQPGIRASDVVSKTLGDIKEKIAKFTSEDGFISAKDLYTIRKEIGNTIKKNSQETANWDKRLTGGLERDLQRNIDDAIEAAGGSRWKEYLSTYAEKSKPIAQMKIGQALETKLDPALGTKQRASGYAEALRKMGAEGELNAMTPEQINALQMVGGDLSRNASMNELAKAGRIEALRRIGSEVKEAPPSGMFSPVISVTRGLYNRLSGQATDRILDALAQNMDNPQAVAKLMQDAKPFERRAIIDALMRYQGAVPQVIDQTR